MVRNALVTCVAAFVFAGFATAAQVDVFFTGTVDGVANPDDTFIALDDFVQGSFTYDSNALVTLPPGEYAGAITNLFVEIIQDDGNGGGIGTLVVIDETGDIFVGADEISFFYGPAPQQLGDNFDLTLFSGPALNNSLQTATGLMDAAGFDIVPILFNEGYGTIDNDFTAGNVNFIVDFVEITVPEPASATVLLVGLGLLAGRRSRKRSRC